MKTIIATVLIILFTGVLGYAQEEKTGDGAESLFGNEAKVTGWFIDLNNSYSKLNEQNAHLPGLAGGVIVNKNFKIGLIGKSLTCHETCLQYDDVLDEPVYLVGGHAGLFLEASPIDNRVVHFSVPFIVGIGGVEYRSKEIYPDVEDEGELDYCHRQMSTSPYWIIEPGANIEVNVTGFMRLYTGYSYRWMMGVKLENTKGNAFNGSNFNFGIRFGKF